MSRRVQALRPLPLSRSLPRSLSRSRATWRIVALPVWRAMALVFAVILGACGSDGPTEPTVDGLRIQEIILAGDDGTFAFSHRDHWHGAPVVRQGESAGYTLYFSELQLAADDHDPPPTESWISLADHPGYAVHVVVEDPALASWNGDPSRGTLVGHLAGASRMSFVVRRGTTTVYEAPPLNFRVQEPAN